MAGKKYCIRCGHEMWYDETKKRWYCTKPKCVRYKPQPEPEPTPEPTPTEPSEEQNNEANEA